jgi:hypothetical protein
MRSCRNSSHHVFMEAGRRILTFLHRPTAPSPSVCRRLAAIQSVSLRALLLTKCFAVSLLSDFGFGFGFGFEAEINNVGVDRNLFGFHPNVFQLVH